MISAQGLGASVFGLMHNDHRWLEVFDDIEKVWVPADPSLGIFGVESWIKTRVGFAERPEYIKDMIVPFVVVIKEDGKIVENRSNHYLIDGFNSLYNNKLEKMNAWGNWVHLIKQLSTYGALAFVGKENLHLYTNLMEQLLLTYEELKSEFSNLE